MPWELFFILGTMILGVVMIYGVRHYRLKSARAQQVSEKATRMEYEDPERFEKERDRLAAEAERAEDAAEKKA